MKLRNKKTGEICELFGISCKGLRTFLQLNDSRGNFKFECETLAELEREWEDYEEPKDNEYWFIDDIGRIQFSSEVLDEIEEHPNNWIARKLYGNYFNSREEAEKAVEKLKAWKRLKDKGFEFKGINMTDGSIKTGLSKGVSFYDCEGFYDDMTLIFGDEE